MSRKNGAACRFHEGHDGPHANWYAEEWWDGDAAVADTSPASPVLPRSYHALAADLDKKLASSPNSKLHDQWAAAYTRLALYAIDVQRCLRERIDIGIANWLDHHDKDDIDALREELLRTLEAVSASPKEKP